MCLVSCHLIWMDSLIGIVYLLSTIRVDCFASANIDVSRYNDDVHVSGREWNDDVMAFNTGVLSICQCLNFEIDLGMAKHLPSLYL